MLKLDEMAKLKKNIKNPVDIPPKDWKGTIHEWREKVVLDYVLSQGYEQPEDEERNRELNKIGWGIIE